MEEKNVKPLSATIGEIWDNAVKEKEKKYIRLGIELAAVRNAFWYTDLIKFLKGDDESSGSMYFCNLKPLYDKYGYDLVNKTLLELDKEAQSK